VLQRLRALPLARLLDRLRVRRRPRDECLEDDLAVTATGCENLSAILPSTSNDVEAWIKDLWS